MGWNLYTISIVSSFPKTNRNHMSCNNVNIFSAFHISSGHSSEDARKLAEHCKIPSKLPTQKGVVPSKPPAKGAKRAFHSMHRRTPDTPKLCSTCHFMECGVAQTQCSVCLTHLKKTKRQEMHVMDYLLSQEDLGHFSSMNTKLPCTQSRDRPDFVYVLEDRVVVLECDEQEHKYGSVSPTCEREREYRILDSIKDTGRHLAIIRFNPNQKHVSQWRAFENLGQTLRDCFTTADIKHADDGVFRKYLGYSRSQMRTISREYTLMQKGVIQDAQERGSAPFKPPTISEVKSFAPYKSNTHEPIKAGFVRGKAPYDEWMREFQQLLNDAGGGGQLEKLTPQEAVNALICRNGQGHESLKNHNF